MNIQQAGWDFECAFVERVTCVGRTSRVRRYARVFGPGRRVRWMYVCTQATCRSELRSILLCAGSTDAITIIYETLFFCTQPSRNP